MHAALVLLEYHRLRKQLLSHNYCWIIAEIFPSDRHIYIHIPLLEKTTKVLYDKNQTVEELKTLIHQEEGIKRREQVLKFRSCTLSDEKTVHSYGKMSFR